MRLDEIRDAEDGMFPRALAKSRYSVLLCNDLVARSSTDAGASLPPLQPMERPAEDALEDGGKGHRLESEQMSTCADF
jgi:hypothetical protein